MSANRLSTIRNADQVLVLKDGQIIERGTHDQLLAQHGFYYNLYMSQVRRDPQFSSAAGDGRGPANTAPAPAE
jgi:ATP-binding cassette subfamily B protein